MRDKELRTETKFAGWAILAAAVAIQLCLGATYSWSVFVRPLRDASGLSQASAQIPFTLFYIVFPATALFAGGLLERFGPRLCAVCGGVIFGAGWLLASLGAGGFIWTISGIGLIGGVGVGLAYLVPISICILWFPERKGLVTGIAVAGFGGGAALVTQIAGQLINIQGYTPFETFRTLGLAFAVCAGLAGCFMRRPSGSSRTKSKPLPIFATIREPPFLLLYTAMAAGLMAGFTVNANLKELQPASAVSVGVQAVALFAIGNALGRILWGMLFDRLESIVALQANLLLQAALLLSAPYLLLSHIGLQVMAVGAGFNYGGVLVLYAAMVARRWGSERVGRVYGWMFSANIPASFAPLVAGHAYDAWGSFRTPLCLIAAAMALAATLLGRNKDNLTSSLSN